MQRNIEKIKLLYINSQSFSVNEMCVNQGVDIFLPTLSSYANLQNEIPKNRSIQINTRFYNFNCRVGKNSYLPKRTPVTNKVTKKLPVTKQMTKKAPVTKKNHPQAAPNPMILMKSQERERTKEIMDSMNTTEQSCLRTNNVEKGMVTQKNCPRGIPTELL